MPKPALRLPPDNARNYHEQKNANRSGTYISNRSYQCRGPVHRSFLSVSLGNSLTKYKPLLITPMPAKKKPTVEIKKDERLLNHLQRYKAIQADYAASVFRIYNLPQRIAALRRAGHNIITERTTKQQCRYRYVQPAGGANTEAANYTGHTIHTTQPQPIAG